MKKKLGILVLILLIALGGYYFYQNQQKKVEKTEHKTEEKVIKIGAILPLTGAGSSFAKYIKNGLDLALKKQKNKKIKIYYEDSQNKPQVGIMAYKKLVAQNKVDIIIVALSSVAESIKKFAKEDKIPQIGIAVATPNYTENNNYIFRVYPNANTMAGKMAHYAIDSLKCNSFGIIYVNDAFGRASDDAFKNIIINNSKKIILSESYKLLQKDFKNTISKINQLKPECIFLNGYGPAYSSFIKQLFSLKNYDLKLTADMSLGLPIVKNQIKQIKDTLYYVDGKINKIFINDYYKAYNKNPTSYAGYAFDIISIINYISKRKQINNKPSEIIRKELFKVQNFPGTMGNISIKDNGDCNLEFTVKNIINK